MSAVASGLLASDMEKELLETIKSKPKNKKNDDDEEPRQDDNQPPAEPVALAKRMTKTTTIKKVRLTPGKVLSMVVGNDGGTKKTSETPTKVVGKKKKHKTDVKEAIFGPGDFEKKLKKRGSSSEDEGVAKEKKPKRRRRRRKEATPEPPPPKDPTPQPEADPVEQPALVEEEIIIPEKSPKEPTPPPPPAEEPAPEDEQPKEATPQVSKEQETETSSEPPKEKSTTAESPLEESQPTVATPEGPLSDTEEEEITSRLFPTELDKSKTNFGSLCCPVAEKYTSSSIGRLRWILLLIYRGPLCCTGRRILKTAPLPDMILGPTFDSVLLEYFSLMLDAIDELLTRMYPGLDRIPDLMVQIDEDEEMEGEQGNEKD